MRFPVSLAGWSLASVVTLAGGCAFRQGAAPIDAAPEASPDAPPGPLASCNLLHAADSSLPSGTYVIDPDGPGGDPPISVTCDMIVEGGGWTVIFFAPVTNLTTPVNYTSSTPRLLADAQTALIAYRDASQVAAPNHASFDLPGFWRIDTPFNYPATDLITPFSIDGAASASGTLRYGYENFANLCSDPWSPATGQLGRLCIVGTNAPFYNGFGSSLPDNCSSSLQNWNVVPCTSDLRFSIAVR